ncbi:MAG: anthranilate synthase component II [Planctomycetota bacterium]|jgi:anthranilate synthase/aminodeoxychorismate synthase-like glutamine amidotransferase
MVVVVDNYDSFTYNLVQALGVLGCEVRVFRNDRVTIEELRKLRPGRIVISPGPCTPREAGISCEVIRAFAGEVPVFGVCLGHQCIAHAFGGKVVRAKRLMHGKTSRIAHDGKGVFAGVPDPFVAARYHSLIVPPDGVPEGFEVTARTDDRDEIMGIRHSEMPIEGAQFHPESFLTPEGPTVIRNFVEGANAQDAEGRP